MSNVKYISACFAAGLIFSAGVPASAVAKPGETYQQCLDREFKDCMDLFGTFKTPDNIVFCYQNAHLMCRPTSGGGASASGSFAPHQSGGSPLGKPANPGKGISLKPKSDNVRKRNRKFQAKTRLKPAVKSKQNAARKGNRKVSLTISGHVQSTVMPPARQRNKLRPVQPRKDNRGRMRRVRNR